MATQGLIQNPVLYIKTFSLFLMGFELNNYDTFSETENGKQFIMKSQGFVLKVCSRYCSLVKAAGQKPAIFGCLTLAEHRTLGPFDLDKKAGKRQ